MKVGIRDASFTTESMSTDFEAPAYFRWDRSPEAVPRFYTDICLSQASGQVHPRVALLIEAPPFRAEHYRYVMEHQSEFDYILTYVRSMLEFGDPKKFLYYPHGGTRIPLHQWGIARKTKLVSMIASNKTDAGGHKLRHEIRERFGSRMDVLGSIAGTWVDKYPGHAPYHYSVVVEGERNDWGFSDHLLDCLCVGTVPIYWGCPAIGNFFNEWGILQFSSLTELDLILEAISTADWLTRQDAILENIEMAKQYRIAENWIYRHYPFLFEGLG